MFVIDQIQQILFVLVSIHLEIVLIAEDDFCMKNTRPFPVSLTEYEF